MDQVKHPHPLPRFVRPLPLVAALLSLGLCSFATWAAPQAAVIRAGTASVSQSGTNTRIDQRTDRAVIDWRSFGVDAPESVVFAQPSRTSATLNRVTGGQLSMILGRIEANGQFVLINPNGIVFGPGSRIDVGSLIASTANVSDQDFMAGRLRFLEAGKPGAGISNQGHLSAADGGLVALVAPHVANSGLIQARLGKVALGAGDTFTLDLYGDGLINVALAPEQALTLLDSAGKPLSALISQSGKIEATGGQVVLINAPTAKAVLDQVINLSGTIQADSALQQDGRVVLLGHGGTVEVRGTIGAQGVQAGQRGGTVEILGDTVHIAAGSQLNVSGDRGGGTIHVGGALQGRGSTYRARTTAVDAGAALTADAADDGKGGNIVVWADGHTRYAGSISARGGARGGDGGQVEVSGKGSLVFAGAVDASAPFGAAGSLLLDPLTFDIGPNEARVINTTLRTGTSTTLRADLDVNVNAMIDGRGGISGGGLTLTAGQDINVNDFIVTNNGAVSLDAAGGTVRVAAGKGVFTQSAPISVRTGNNLSTGPMITTGPLSFTSTGGSVSLDTAISAATGPVSVNAAGNVSINQPVVNLRNGSSFTANAGGDVMVNAQVDGRGGSAGGAIDLVAGRSVQLNDFLLTNNGMIRVRANTGSIVTASAKGVFAYGGAIDLIAGSDFTTGILATTGPVNLASTSGSVTLGQGIDGTVGALTLTAAQDANLEAEVLNLRSGAPLSVTAGRDIAVRAQVDGRGGVAGGKATLSAGRTVNLLQSIATNEGAIRVSAATGTVAQGAGVQLRSGAAPIAVSAGGELVSGSYATTGSVDLRSTSGAVTVGEPIYETTGTTAIAAATDVNVDRRVENVRTGASLAINAGRDIRVNSQIGQDRDAITDTGTITLIAGTDVIVADDVVTRNAALTVQGRLGTVRIAAGKQLRTGNGTLTVSAGGDLSVGDASAPKPNPDTPFVTSGALDIASSGGTLYIEAPIPATTGPVNLYGGNAVHVNERIYSNDENISITAGSGGIVMNTTIKALPIGPLPTDETNCTSETVCTFISDIDARRGNVTLLAQGDINAPSVRTAGTLRITSTAGKIIDGAVFRSKVTSDDSTFPQSVRLEGELGIDNFEATAEDIEALSAAGSVAANLRADALYIRAAHDISGNFGGTAELVAGRDVNLSTFCCNLLWVSAGRDFKVDGDVIANALKAQAGGNIVIDPIPASRFRQTWIAGPGGSMTLRNPADGGRVEPMGGLWLSAPSGSIDIVQPVHVSDSLLGFEATPQPTMLNARGNMTMGQLETIGPVSLNSDNGNITITHPIGAPVDVVAPGLAIWNPNNQGVDSLNLTASGVGATVNLQGARAEGPIVINSPSGDVTASFALTSNSSAVVVNAASFNASPAPTATVSRLPISVPDIPVGPPAPGPLRATPVDAPPIPVASGPAAPALPEILVTAPDAIDVGIAGPPGSAGTTKSTQVADALQAADTAAALATIGTEMAADGNGTPGVDGTVAVQGGVLLFSGGRGLAQSVDLGRSGAFGSPSVVYADEDDDESLRRKPKSLQ